MPALITTSFAVKEAILCSPPRVLAMRMNDFVGKEFLSTVRGEDFAHAGDQKK